jgi:hypothetical protein
VSVCFAARRSKLETRREKCKNCAQPKKDVQYSKCAAAPLAEPRLVRVVGVCVPVSWAFFFWPCAALTVPDGLFGQAALSRLHVVWAAECDGVAGVRLDAVRLAAA